MYRIIFTNNVGWVGIKKILFFEKIGFLSRVEKTVLWHVRRLDSAPCTVAFNIFRFF